MADSNHRQGKSHVGENQELTALYNKGRFRLCLKAEINVNKIKFTVQLSSSNRNILTKRLIIISTGTYNNDNGNNNNNNNNSCKIKFRKTVNDKV